MHVAPLPAAGRPSAAQFALMNSVLGALYRY
jgi:hypothetical protein